VDGERAAAAERERRRAEREARRGAGTGDHAASSNLLTDRDHT
jgi:hypothetical protein